MLSLPEHILIITCLCIFYKEIILITFFLLFNPDIKRKKGKQCVHRRALIITSKYAVNGT